MPGERDDCAPQEASSAELPAEREIDEPSVAASSESSEEAALAMTALDPRVRKRQRRQRAARSAERHRRVRLLEVGNQLHEQGMAWKEVADILQVAPRTLRDWRHGLPQLQCRGRPCREVDAAERSDVFWFMQRTGPMIGLAALRAVFPNIPRATLDDLLSRYRLWWRKKHAWDGFRLTWLVPGTVWAMDFTEPKFKIDGKFPYLFTVRDLATHYHLCWRPVASEKAKEVIPILLELFQCHGRPLVMKSDNGSAFIAEETQAMFREQGVAVLYSPPRKPQYNGALERSNTTMKSWTGICAESAGRPMNWRSEDLMGAMRIANTLSYPFGPEGPTPEASWRDREPISQERRDELWEALARERMVANEKLGFDQIGEEAMSNADCRQRDRVALSEVLPELGYLHMTRVRRYPCAPKRPSAEKLAQTKAAMQERASAEDRVSEVADTEELEGTVDVSAESTSNLVHQRCVEPSSFGKRRACAPSRENLLATSNELDTMRAQSDASIEEPASPRASPSKRCGWVVLTWLRRTITPLLSRRKAAEIK